MGGGRERREDGAVEDGGAGPAVHAGLGDGAQHLGLHPLEQGVGVAEGGPRTERDVVRIVEDGERDDGALAPRGLAQRPDQRALTGRRSVDLDEQVRGGTAGEQRAQAQRLDRKSVV